ncbi:MAG: phosphoribosylaminoimidazolesuccinocarboxamide synthase [Candidatus Woesearchaeota archaeon]
MQQFMTEDEARKIAEENLDNTFSTFDRSRLLKEVDYHKGKVRENFTLPDAGARPRRILATSDRVSVFDSVVGTIPFKGQVLDNITHWWFRQTGFMVPNHVIDRPSSTITVADQCTPLKVEMVVRNFLTGTSSTSIWTAYDQGDREFCGNDLDDGMEVHQRLPYPMITPSTKADCGDHDESVSVESILKRGVLPGSRAEQKKIWNQLHNYSISLFGMGSLLSNKIGLILVDTKYEFGMTKDGRVVVIDEIHTPDSSRFWEKGSYTEAFLQGKDPKQLSKQFARDAVIAQGYDPKKGGKVPMLEDDARVECAARYIMLCQRLTGRPFVPDARPTSERVYGPLEKLGILR